MWSRKYEGDVRLLSLLRKSDYHKESKKNNVVSPRRASHGGIATSKKVTLPTQHRTLNHKCSQCERKDAKKYQITLKESRWLCVICVKRYQNKNIKEKPNFVKASRLVVK